MFSRDRFNLSRFSLGSQDNSIPIKVEFTDELKQVAGIAVPVQTTMFLNDVMRGNLRGAITMRASFESAGAMFASCEMNANIIIGFDEHDNVAGVIFGSQNSNIIATLSDDLRSRLHGSKIMPYAAQLRDEMRARAHGVKNVKADHVLNEVLTSMMSASSQTTEVTRIDITLPPGSELRIDSETYRALLDGNNVLYAQNGDWLTLARELLYIDVESATGGSLVGTIIYTERYL